MNEKSKTAGDGVDSRVRGEQNHAEHRSAQLRHTARARRTVACWLVGTPLAVLGVALSAHYFLHVSRDVGEAIFLPLLLLAGVLGFTMANKLLTKPLHANRP